MLIDITRPLVEGIKVYAGDAPFTRGWTCRVSDGHAANVSWVRGTSHGGTHVDFPSHMIDGAPEPRLEKFVGSCFVCDRSLSLLGPKVLIKGTDPLTSADVDALLDVECDLVGIEGMSVDALDSEELPITGGYSALALLSWRTSTSPGSPWAPTT